MAEPVASSRLLIHSVRVLDGSGAASFLGSVLVEGGLIARVQAGDGADAAPAGCQLLDGSGLCLCPGFIDSHCHDDAAMLRFPDRREKALQGVSTVVVGNCSFSLFPAPPASADSLREHFAGLLGATAEDELFDSFASYAAALSSRRIAINVVALVGHAALRLAVVGSEDRPATDEETAGMQRLLAEQLRQGAAGLSLGLAYAPSSFSSLPEQVALAYTVREHGSGGVVAAHIRSYSASLLQSVDEFLSVLQQSGAAGLLSHLQCAGRPHWGSGIHAALSRLEAAVSEHSIDVAFDMYPYTAGSTLMLQLLPPAALDGGIERLLLRLQQAEQRDWLRQAVEQGSGSAVADNGWESVVISAVESASLKHLEGRTMAAAALSEAITPFNLLCRCIEADRGRTGILLFQLHEADVRAACCHPLHMFCSDGLPRPGSRPHPRAFGTFARVLGSCSRDWRWLSLEQAVRKMTAMPAQRFGLRDRGLLAAGCVADLVLFDADSVAEQASFDQPDREATGIRWLFVAGQPVVAHGRITDCRPGQVLSPQPKR